jgi:hypothetical protein
MRRFAPSRPLHGSRSFYRKQGWTVRPCGWNEFEVSNAIAEIVVEAVPVILHGAVAEPLETIDLVLAPLNDSAIDYFCECYASDGAWCASFETRHRQ